MGIKNFSKVLNEYAPQTNKKRIITDYKNKVIAVDTSLILYQYVSAIRNTGKDLTDNNNNSVSHIYAILQKTLSLLKKHIKPIYVFDGKAPKLKSNTIKSRKNNKNKAIENEKNAKDEKDKIKYFKRSLIITTKQFNECKKILDIIGIPYIQADGEADIVCAALVKQNIAYATLSEDIDMLTFGCCKLVKNLTKTNIITELDLSDILKGLDLNNAEFIDFCILLGCDYLDTIKGIGYKTAYKIIKEHKSIEEFIKNNSKFTIPENYDYKKVIEYFKQTDKINIKKDKLKFNKSDVITLGKELEKYNFNSKNINIMVNAFINYSISSSIS